MILRDEGNLADILLDVERVGDTERGGVNVGRPMVSNGIGTADREGDEDFMEGAVSCNGAVFSSTFGEETSCSEGLGQGSPSSSAVESLSGHG